MADEARLRELLEPVVIDQGFALVRVQLMGGLQSPTLQVMAEDPATGQLTLDQCATISRAVSEVMDAEDPIDTEYRLEVSSPGIDRPLTRAADFASWAGHEAKIELAAPLEGRKRFQGLLRGIEGGVVRIDVDGAAFALPLAGVKTAKLVLTDALIAATRPLSTEGADELETIDEPANDNPDDGDDAVRAQKDD